MSAVWKYEQSDKIRHPSWSMPLFKVAFDLHAKCSDPVEHLPPCAAYGSRSEVESLEQCKVLLSKERVYQALIIQERCLGLGDSVLRPKMFELALCHSGARPSHVEAIALLSRVMLSITNEVENIPVEYIAHNYNGMVLWDLPLTWTLQKYANCSSKDKQNIDLTYFLQFITRGLEHVKSSILKLRCLHGNSWDDMSMLTLHGLRFLCLWLQQERAMAETHCKEGIM